jgi:transposase
LSEEQAAALLEQFKAHPDATLDEHCALWLKQSGISLSNPTMWRWTKRLGWTRKKRP